MSHREPFLAGERPDDVLMYFAEDAVSGVEALADVGERVEDGVVLVVEGEQGRAAFESATGLDPMAFARDAMDTDGTVDPGCTGGTCPARGERQDGERQGGEDAGGEQPDDGDDHDARFVFAFVEGRNEEVGGIYAEGDVVHAYVACTCGETYSDTWVAGGRDR